MATVAELERKLADAQRTKQTLDRANARLLKLAEWAGNAKLRPLAKFLRKRAENVRKRRGEVLDRITEIKREIRQAGHIPSWLPSGYSEHWQKPWAVATDPSSATEFKRLIWEHGFASPNFTRREAGGQDRHPLGCPVPESLRGNAQRHAFMLERARHDLGDPAMGPGSWYRCPPHNSAVGGASASQHMQANATDWFDEERSRLGGERFDAVMERTFTAGGRGYQSFVGGPIRHVDNGPQRSWVYA